MMPSPQQPQRVSPRKRRLSGSVSPCKRIRPSVTAAPTLPGSPQKRILPVATEDGPTLNAAVMSNWAQLHAAPFADAAAAWLDVEKAGGRDWTSTPGLVRLVDEHGCLPRLRAEQWLEWCGGAQLSVKALLATAPPARGLGGAEDGSLEARTVATFAQIDLDVPRTCPGRVEYLTEHSGGRVSLTRVLRAYALHNPAVGYLQSMNFIGALALAVMGGDEDAALAVCVAIFDRALPSYYAEFSGLQRDTLLVKYLLHRHHPDVARVLMACPCDIVATLAPGRATCSGNRRLISQSDIQSLQKRIGVHG